MLFVYPLQQTFHRKNKNQKINWSSYCFVWSLFFQFSLFLLSEVGWHPNSSAVNHQMVDTMASSIALFHDHISGRCMSYSIWLVSELDPLHGEEGSQHALTFELSLGRNADLTNDCHSLASQSYFSCLWWAGREKYFFPSAHTHTHTKKNGWPVRLWLSLMANDVIETVCH